MIPAPATRLAAITSGMISALPLDWSLKSIHCPDLGSFSAGAHMTVDFVMLALAAFYLKNIPQCLQFFS